jgi:sucrose-6-phosphatase
MPFLLVTDLDHTLVGDDAATLRLNHLLQKRRESFYLVYATGRSLFSFRQLCQDFQAHTGQSLLAPDYLVAGVGSEIYRPSEINRPGNINGDVNNDLAGASKDSQNKTAATTSVLDSELVLDSEWAAHLSQNWQLPAVMAVVEGFKGLQRQPASEQNPWKLSYCLTEEFFGEDSLPPNELRDDFTHQRTAQVAALQVQLTHQLTAKQLAATVILSSNRDLDILPPQGSKGKALTYLRQKLNIPTTATLVCGDSGNDISLFEEETLGVVMANARPELLRWHAEYGQACHYLARQPYAAGILEALEHFAWI